MAEALRPAAQSLLCSTDLIDVANWPNQVILPNTCKNGNSSARLSAEDFLRILECPVCQEVLSLPVHQCVLGHSICNDCKPQLKQCPMCKEEFSKTRNFLVEEIISSIRLEETVGSFLGGENRILPQNITNGQTFTVCPLYLSHDCFQNFKICEIRQHLISKHKARVYPSLEEKILYQTSTPKDKGFQIHGNVTILESDGGSFLTCMLSGEDKVYWIILSIDSTSSARKYSGQIVLQTEDGNQKICWTAPVLPLQNQTVNTYAFEEPLFKATCTVQDLSILAPKNSIKISYKITTQNGTTLTRTPTKQHPLSKLPVSTPAVTFPRHLTLTSSLPRVYMLLGVDGSPNFRITIELRSDVTPRTAENFRTLCTGENGFGYQNTSFHNVSPAICEGGEMEVRQLNGHNNLTWITSAYPSIPMENFVLKHDVPGVVGMGYSNEPRRCSGTEFYLTLVPTPSLNNSCVVFGRIVDGLETLKTRVEQEYRSCGLTRMDSSHNHPSTLTIKGCGQL